MGWQSWITNPKTWFADRIFRKLFKDAGVLLSGNLLALGFDFFSLLITGRALGATDFGVFVLMQTYALSVDTLLNFQSWQAVTKYGADALGMGDDEDFDSTVKFGSLLDVGSAVIATMLALAGISVFADIRGLDQEVSIMASVFCIVILFNLQGTPLAVLRLFDRFDLLARQRAMIAFGKMVVLGVGFMFGLGLWGFVWLWVVSYVIGYLVVLFLGWRELLHRNHGSAFRASPRVTLARHPGMIKFVVSTNLSSSIRMVPQDFDVLLVGYFLGATQAGIYKVARQFGMVPGRFTAPLQESIYPSMAKLWANGDRSRFIRFIFRIGLLSGLGGLTILTLFWLVGDPVITLTFGPEFAPAYPLLLIYMSGICIYMFGVTFRPAILSMEHAERILIVYIIGTLLFLGVLVTGLPEIGVIAAPLSQVTFHATWFLIMSWSIYRYLKSSPAKSELQIPPSD